MGRKPKPLDLDNENILSLGKGDEMRLLKLAKSHSGDVLFAIEDIERSVTALELILGDLSSEIFEDRTSKKAAALLLLEDIGVSSKKIRCELGRIKNNLK